MTYAERADIAAKTIKVIESCTRKSHLKIAERYVSLAKPLIDSRGSRDLGDSVAKAWKKADRRIMNKPKCRFMDGEWVRVIPKSPECSRVDLDIEKKRRAQLEAMNRLVQDQRMWEGGIGSFPSHQPLGQSLLGSGF